MDFSLSRAERLAAIYGDLGIKATFFIRLHAKEYNPFDFENFRILRAIQKAGHEIGYHSEIVDQAAIWHEEASTALRRDLAVMEAMLGSKVFGAASHGGLTALNNLDFWTDHDASEFGLSYEAYQDGFIGSPLYFRQRMGPFKSYDRVRSSMQITAVLANMFAMKSRFNLFVDSPRYLLIDTFMKIENRVDRGY